jgi:hypothetical protein
VFNEDFSFLRLRAGEIPNRCDRLIGVRDGVDFSRQMTREVPSQFRSESYFSCRHSGSNRLQNSIHWENANSANRIGFRSHCREGDGHVTLMFLQKRTTIFHSFRDPFVECKSSHSVHKDERLL